MSSNPTLQAPALHFQRGDGRLRVKKPPRMITLRARHVLSMLGGAALFFFGAYEVYSFVIAWPRLEVKSVRVLCPDPNVRALVQEAAGAARWGNILLLDLDRARREVETIPWVKEARARKQFPSELILEIVPRKPAAILEKESLFLLDGDGVVIEQAGRDALPDLPLLTDAGRFAAGAEEKIRLAFACLADLPPGVRERVDALDLSDPADVILRFRGSRTRLLLGDDRFADRVAAYEERREAWERAAGELDYVILWSDDRIVYRPFSPDPAAKAKEPANPAKERP